MFLTTLFWLGSIALAEETPTDAQKTVPVDRSGLLIGFEGCAGADLEGVHPGMGVSLQYRERYGVVGWQITAAELSGTNRSMATIAAVGPVFYSSRTHYSGFYAGGTAGLGLASESVLSTSLAYPWHGVDTAGFVGAQLIPGMKMGLFFEAGVATGIYFPSDQLPEGTGSFVSARGYLRIGADKVLGSTIVGNIAHNL